MSRNNTDTTRYDDMLILFGKNNNNKKARFILDILFDNVHSTYSTSNSYDDVSYDICPTIMDARLNKDNFSSPNKKISDAYNNGDCHNENFVHSEIRDFGYNYNYYSNLYNNYQNGFDYTKQEHDNKTSEIIQLIKKYSGNKKKATDELSYFKQQLIKKILVISDDSGIELNPINWSNVSSFRYNTIALNTLTENQVNSIDFSPYAEVIKAPYFNMLFPHILTFNFNYTDTYFNFNLNKNLLHELLINNNNKINIGVSSFFSEEEESECTYYRKIDQIEKLFMMNENGDEIDVSITSTNVANYMNTTQPTQICNDLGFSDNNKCTEYLSNCLFSNESNDITKCKNFMLEPTYWDSIKFEIKNLNPELGKLTLEKFGFKVVNEFDEDAKQRLHKFQSYSNWIKDLNKLSTEPNSQLTSNEFQKINDNLQLKGYLDLLVNKINSNPSILNPNYICHTSEVNKSHAKQFKDTRLYAYGIKSINSDRYSNYTNIKMVNDLITTNTSYFINLINKMLLNNPFVVNSNIHYVNSGIMRGGGGSQTILSEFKPSHEIITDVFNGLNKHLETLNKKISPADLMEINKLLGVLRKSENKLVKVISYLEKYFDVIELYKDYDHNNVLSIDHIRNFTETTKNTSGNLTSTQDKIFNILTKVALGLDPTN